MKKHKTKQRNGFKLHHDGLGLDLTQDFLAAEEKERLGMPRATQEEARSPGRSLEKRESTCLGMKCLCHPLVAPSDRFDSVSPGL